MAIPIGTTARNLESIARWALAAAVVFGMLVCWHPGYLDWGAMTVGLLVVWTLWLVWKTVLADRSMPAHTIHVALIVPAIILAYHAARTGLGTAREAEPTLGGSLNMSMIFHLWLLGTGVMVSQSLLPRAARHAVVVGLCGLAMMGGAAAAVIYGPPGPYRHALGSMGFAGIAVWLTPLWGAGEYGHVPHPLANRGLRGWFLAVAAIAALLLAWFSPLEAVLSLAVAAVVLFGAAVSFRQDRKLLLGMAAGLAIAVGAVLLVRPGWLEPPAVALSAFGKGERAFSEVSAANSGYVVVLATTGWVGAGWLALVAAAGAGRLLFRARREPAASRGTAVAWTIAAALAACALLGRGGLFVPSATLAVAFTWGLLPTMLGRRPTRRSGLFVLLGLGIVLLLLGLARQDGLVSQITRRLGGNDSVMHVCAGFFLSVVLTWLLGARRWYLGVAAVGISLLIGASGEVAQGIFSRRNVQMGDWLAHAAGSAAALPVYLLCLGSRWCESPDARDDRAPASPPQLP